MSVHVCILSPDQIATGLIWPRLGWAVTMVLLLGMVAVAGRRLGLLLWHYWFQSRQSGGNLLEANQSKGWPEDAREKSNLAGATLRSGPGREQWLKQTESALQTSRETLKLAVEVSQIGTWDWHIASNQLRWDDQHYRLMGYEPGAVVPNYDLWRKAVHPDDLPRIDRAVAHALTTQSEYFEEYRLMLPDGQIRWVLGKGRGLQNQQGQTIHMLGVMLDITEAKQTAAHLRQSEIANQQILQAIPDLLIWMTADGTCVGLSGTQNVANLLPDYHPIGTNQYELLPADLAQLRQEAIRTALTTGHLQIYEQEITIGGRLQYEEVRVVPVEADQVLVIVRDISDRKQAELALAQSEERYRLVTENMSDLVCLHQPDGRFLYISPSCHALLGYDPEDLMNQNPYPLVHPEDRRKIREAYQKVLAGDLILVTYRVRHQSGAYIWLETLAKPIRDRSGQITHLQVTSRDVGDRVAVEAQLRHDALHDALTGLPNRSLLMERLDLALKRTRRHPDLIIAVLFLDFDHFKVINDSLGHLIGDRLLITIAGKLQGFIRDTDLVSRIGGDEFVILLEEIEKPKEAVMVAERMLVDLQTPLLVDGREVFITASIGIVFSSAKHHQAEDLLRDADIAMYRAKADGRSQYAIFDPQMHDQVLQRLQLENDLRRALDQGEFRLYYQPIVALDTLQLVGFEALLRWQNPVLGLVAPDRFITVAEETGLIIPIGDWVLRTGCQQLAHWQTRIPAARHLKLTVNLSVKQLQPSILQPALEQALSASGIAPQSLTLEITESLVVQQMATTRELLSQIQAMGVRISIDDFGTGYSSLSYLHQLPADALKIDRAFVSPTEPGPKPHTIAASIVALSNLLGLAAIAEGIETLEQLQWLQGLNCEYGQGYLFSRPVRADQAETFLLQGSCSCGLPG